MRGRWRWCALCLLWACGGEGAGGDGAAPEGGGLDRGAPDALAVQDGQLLGDAWRPDRRAPDGGAPAADGGDSSADQGVLDQSVPDTLPADVGADAGEPVDPNLLLPGGPPIAWGGRACEVEVQHAAPGAREVWIAGPFTGWGDAPLPLREGPPGAFSIRLGAEDGLAPGVHPYKLIVDGAWQLDPAARLRRYEGDCLNSALRIPACAAGPEIQIESLSARPEAGEVALRFTVQMASDGAELERVTARVDGAPLPEGAAIVEAASGTIQVVLRGLGSGKHRISLRAIDVMGRAAAPVELPVWLEVAPFQWADASLYLLLIDRFANGDRDNDRSEGAPVGYPADWHGGDLQGVLRVMQSGYFESIGVNTLWLSPINAQADGHYPGRDADHRYTGYHGYWPVDGRRVDDRFGGDAALHALVAEAHRRGIRVLLDYIANQVHEDHVYFAEHPEWFRTGCVCGMDPGCGWSERPLDCLFAGYLPDVNWRDEDAAAQFIADALYLIDVFDVDGFRVDAVKHVEPGAIYSLREALAQRFEQGGARVVMLGETAVGEGDRFEDGCGVVYGDGYQWVDAYTGPHALDGQFDFPSHHRMAWGLLSGELGYDALERVVVDLETRYQTTALNVQFLGSHDTSRMASRAAGDRARGCRWAGEGACAALPGVVDDPAVYQRLRRALAVLRALPGIPLLYYGDELALPGGNDPDNRRDMPWVGELAGVGVGVAPVSPPQEALRSWLGVLGDARRASPALRRGARTSIVAEPDLWVSLYRDAETGDVALVAVNRGPALAGRLLGPIAGLDGPLAAAAGEGHLSAGADGWRLDLPAGEAAVFLP